MLHRQAPKFSAKRAFLREELMQAALSDEEVGDIPGFTQLAVWNFHEMSQVYPRFTMEINARTLLGKLVPIHGLPIFFDIYHIFLGNDWVNSHLEITVMARNTSYKY